MSNCEIIETVGGEAYVCVKCGRGMHPATICPCEDRVTEPVNNYEIDDE